jgi:RNA recognition motif-containing protein
MAGDDARKLFVAGLSDSVTEEVLKGLFAGTGATSVEVNIPRDRMTGRPRGFAFVTLGSAEEAAKARSELDGSLQAGRSMAVRPFTAEGGGGGGGGGGREARPARDGQGQEERTLYVRNLPYECTREDVAEVFKGAGVTDIDRIHLPVGMDGRGKGFGFVTLRNAAAAQGALPSLQNLSLRGRPIVVNIARAREDRERDRASFGPPGGGPGGLRDMPPQPPFSRGGGEGRRDGHRFDGGARGGDGGGEDDSRNKNRKGNKRGGGERERHRRDEGMNSPRGRKQITDWDDD